VSLRNAKLNVLVNQMSEEQKELFNKEWGDEAMRIFDGNLDKCQLIMTT
jgi:hypothetical protein